MKKSLAVLLSLGLATSGVSASERFLSDKPSPLKLAKPGDPGGVVRFGGTARLTGRFVVGWELFNNKPSYLRVVFFPDKDSMAQLPHAAGSPPVTELIVSNREQAMAGLLDNPDMAQRILAKDQLSAAGEAAIVIRNYRTAVECDHRWYIAELTSVSKRSQMADGAAEVRHAGC